MIALKTYQQLEDAWLDGVEAWCRAAPGFVLGGGRAWLVTVSDGQANWIKRRLLRAGVSLFGVQFLDARALRRELCQRCGLPAQALGAETLEFLLRLRALAATGEGSSRGAAVARHPGTCLGALDDCAASGWLGEPGLLDEILPDELLDFLPELQAVGAWTPHIDGRLAALAAPLPPPAPPLSVCVFGWDAGYWPLFNLLQAATRAAGGAYLFMPAPRGTSETLQLSWLEACETAFGEDFEPCDASLFESSQSGLAGRLEGSSLAELPTGDEPPAAPELLTGVDGDDTAALVCDFAARWLLSKEAVAGDEEPGERLAILCPGRTPSAVATVRALVAAGIRVEDELGEIAETGLPVQIQRAILDYHQNRGGLDGLLTLVELLNGYAAVLDPGVRAPLLREVCPLDPVEVRQSLHTAFAEVQHHDTRVLCDALSFARARVAGPLRRLIVHLENWPETLPWREALRRWCEGLGALGVPIDDLEPLWSQLQGLPVPDPVPSEAFFRYLGAVLVGASARRSPGAAHRFARVVVTTLEGAAGQTWGGLVLLDSNEGSWPLYPPENPFFDDGTRTRLNVRRLERDPAPGLPRPGHLLTSADRAQLEHFRFLEALENCTGPLAFASVTRAPADTNRELYPNEWLLRCLVESGGNGEQEGRLLDRWRASVRHVVRRPRKLPAAESSHLREVHARRRDPAAPFDEHFFNFQSLTGPDELPWAEPWSAGELDAVWNRPATFALSQVFGALPWRDKGRDLVRGESWVVGRLVHRWVQTALGLAREPRRFDPPDWRAALDGGLRRAQTETEAALRVSLARAHRHGPAPDELPLWWQGTLRKAAWATRRCLESLAEIAQGEHGSPAWLCLERPFRAELSTQDGPLRLQARCDLVLLDRPELDGASCQLIDIRTGAAPATGALKAGDVQAGRGLGLAALLFLARAEGAETTQTRAGVVHPDASNVGLVDDQSATGLRPVLDLLARQQRTLVFGQKGALTDVSGHGQVENLPLATVPVEPATLRLKAERTADAPR